MDPLKFVWKLKPGNVFVQDILVTHKPSFKILGSVVSTSLQYQVVSRFTVDHIAEDGSVNLTQKIDGARLLHADEVTRQTLGASVDKLVGVVHQVTLNAKLEVTRIDGAGAAPQFGNLQLGGGLGLHMASLIDRDGWKELINITFFQMDQPLKPNDRWVKPMTHAWGALGQWAGRTHFAYVAKQDTFHKVSYAHEMAHQAPQGGMLGGMKIGGANFKARQAEGVLAFDTARGRVVAAEERFRVFGVVNMNVLGQNITIEIEEDQHFALRIRDR
jgi:hypothetical protein